MNYTEMTRLKMSYIIKFRKIIFFMDFQRFQKFNIFIVIFLDVGCFKVGLFLGKPKLHKLLPTTFKKPLKIQRCMN